MQHEISEIDGVLVVALNGEIDLQTSPEARKILLDAVDRNSSIMVDLAGVAYIDSSGVASLVEALQAAKKAGGDLSLVSVSEGAMRVLKLARLDKVFAIHDSVAAAQAAGG